MTNKTKILIVDDDADVRETAAEILSMHGYDVRDAGSAFDAYEENGAFGADIFLLDVKMPGISGLGLLKKLDIRDKTCEAIMMTGHESLEDAQRAMELGAYGYITKPISAEKLIDNISRAEERVVHKKNQREHEQELEKKAQDSARDLANAWRIMEDKEILMDGILNGMGEGICAVDCNENIVYMNSRGQEILQLTFAACAGESLRAAIAHFEWAPQLLRMIRNPATSPHANRLVTIARAGGARHYLVRLSDFCDASGARVGMIINLIEQTARVESERLRDFFLSTVAHELRTPVTIIKNYLEIMSMKQWSAADYHEMISDMDATGTRLTGLVNNIIALSGLAGADFAPENEPVDIEALCAKWMRENEAIADEKNVSISIANAMHNGHIKSDARLLATAIGCVCGNAVKFNKQNGSVTIALKTENNEERPYASIEVTDTGIGMSQHVRESLFAGFKQGEDPLTRHYEGIGVGLYLTKRVMEKLGGSVEVESREGEGSRFTLRVPM